MLNHDGDRTTNIENAVAAAQKASELAPHSAHYSYFLSQIYLYSLNNNDHYQKGISAIQKAIELDWHDPEYYFNLAYFYQKHGESQKALDELDRALAIYNEESAKKVLFYDYFYENFLSQKLAKIEYLRNLILEQVDPQASE